MPEKTIKIKDGNKICPVTGLSITQRPEWVDINLGEAYSVSFRLIGDRILLSIPEGNSGKNGMNRLFKEREKVLEDAGLYNDKYVEIKDFSGIVGATTREGRNQFLGQMIKERERGNLLGFWGFNSTISVKWALNSGVRFSKLTFPIVIVDNYKTAIENTIRTLKESGLFNLSELFNRKTRDEWFFKLDDFSTKLETIGEDIIYTESYGLFKEHHVAPLFNLYKKVLQEMRLHEGRYYKIHNWRGVKKSTWKASTQYIEELKELNKTYPCTCTLLYGLNKFMGALVNISKKFIPFTIATVHDLEEAVEKIIDNRNDREPLKMTKRKKTKKVFTENQINKYIEDIFQYIVTINWDHEGIDIDLDKIDETHTFKPLYDSISLIKQDFDANIQDINNAVGELKESEERFRIMFESSNDLICITDINDKILWVNTSWCRLLGYKPEELADPLEKIHPDDLPGVREEWESMKQDKKEITNMEYRYKTAYDNYMFLETSVRKLNTTNKKYLFIISHDITNREKAEREKLRLQDQIRQSEKLTALGKLAGGIAHDFKNHLFGIAANARLIKGKSTNDNSIKECTDNIIRSANRSSELTKQLLAFARRGKYQSVAIDMHSTIYELVALLERTIDKKIHIHTQLNAEKPVAQGDPSQIENALLNLAFNARDAMQQGGTLTFLTDNIFLDEDFCSKSEYDIVPGLYIQISVRDTGKGINDNDLQYIFEPFYTTKEKGNGLGLSAVYGTVNGHNGAISIKTEIGVGTTASIYLPSSSLPTSKKEKTREMKILTNKKNLLIVEDEEIVRNSAKDSLEGIGFGVVTFPDGSSALQYYKKLYNKTDLILLDMILPDYGVEDLFAEFQKINPSAKIILWSANTFPNTVKSLREKGAIDFIDKGSNIVEFTRRITGIAEGLR